MQIYLSLLKGFNVKIKIVAKEFVFRNILDNLKKLPVLEYSKSKDKYYFTSIYHLDHIYKIASDNGYNVSITDKLEYCHKRFKFRLERISKYRNCLEFNSKFWTQDKECQLYDYQKKAVNVIWCAKRFLNGDDMGLGKTPTAIAIICRAFENNYSRALIVCPNRLKYDWKNAFKKFTIITDQEINVIDLTKKFKCPLNLTDTLKIASLPCKNCNRKNACRREKNDPDHKRRLQLGEGKIVICNYEVVSKMKKDIIDENFGVLIFDEASKMKNYRAETTKAILHIGENLDQDAIVVPMSGTFIENRIEEMYPSMTLVSKGILGQFHNFNNHYVQHDYWGNPIGVKNSKRLRRLIDRHIIRRSIDEEWKDRPELIEINKECEMTKKQRLIYEDAKEGRLKELNDKMSEDKINVAEIGALLNYLIQICDTTETMDSSIKESGKLDILKEIIVDEIAQRHKVVIFSFFGNKVVPILKRELSKYGEVMTITGITKQLEAEKIKERFNRKKKAKFLICSDAMAYGANLQVARYVINFDLPWNPAKVDQRIRRVYRRGQDKSVTVINLITTNSVEDMIMEKLYQKKMIFDRFLGNKKQMPKFSLNDMLQTLRAKQKG